MKIFFLTPDTIWWSKERLFTSKIDKLPVFQGLPVEVSNRKQKLTVKIFLAIGSRKTFPDIPHRFVSRGVVPFKKSYVTLKNYRFENDCNKSKAYQNLVSLKNKWNHISFTVNCLSINSDAIYIYYYNNVMRRWDEETAELSLQKTFSEVRFWLQGSTKYY